MAKLIDLSHPITADMPLFPGTPPVKIKQLHTVEKDDFAEKQIQLTTHVGTHLDAPAHMLTNGKTVDRLPLETFWGRAQVIDVRAFVDQTIPAHLFNALLNNDAPDFLLLYTGFGQKWGTEAYWGRFPVLSEQAAETIGQSRVKGIGFDAPSVDPMDAVEFSIHLKLFSSQKIVIENLTNLHRLPATTFWLSVFPLNLMAADGMPVRAVAIIDEE